MRLLTRAVHVARIARASHVARTFTRAVFTLHTNSCTEDNNLTTLHYTAHKVLNLDFLSAEFSGSTVVRGGFYFKTASALLHCREIFNRLALKNRAHVRLQTPDKAVLRTLYGRYYHVTFICQSQLSIDTH